MRFSLHIIYSIGLKWGKREAGHLEMLFCERDSYYGDAENQSKEHVHQARP